MNFTEKDLCLTTCNKNIPNIIYWTVVFFFGQLQIELVLIWIVCVCVNFSRKILEAWIELDTIIMTHLNCLTMVTEVARFP